MLLEEVKPRVYFVGARDWERRLFDEIIPLPEGTSYNAYIIFGSEKTALIDAVDPTKEDELIRNLEKIGVKKIDYLISNHAEQDHSGAIPKMLELYPDAQVVTNSKGKNFLKDLLLLSEERFKTVEDREIISLGDKTLEFIMAPWVHWPETMLTYLKEDHILFTCDLFGSHLATSNLFAAEGGEVYKAAKKYYAEIMMPFRKNIKHHLEKIGNFELEIIAPSHGPLYSDPQFILKAYKEWISEEVKNEVVIVYVSMHGSTKKMVNYLMEALMERKIKVKLFNLVHTDVGELAMSLVDAATLVIASPTFLVGPHPLVFSAAYLISVLRPKLKFLAIIGSYGWGEKMVESLKNLLLKLSVEILDPVMAKGFPKKEDFRSLTLLAEQIFQKHKEAGIV